MKLHTHALSNFLLVATLAQESISQSVSPVLPSKRGIAYHHDDHAGDNLLLLTNNTSISWYYTWSLYPSQVYLSTNGSIAFLPLIHGLKDASDSSLATVLGRLPASSQHLLSFNEPDGSTDSGGSAISPEDAAASYVKYIVPLRTSTDSRSRTWKISHPSVTGSGRGLDWLKRFLQACTALDKEKGCPTDFVAVHWYGDFGGLSNWLGTLRDFYNTTQPTPKFWITEMALPQGGQEATLSMMNSSISYLDAADYVAAYAWFGAFRSNEANAWTGNAVSLFDDRGGLTDLGALYLGGKERGYETGMNGGGQNAGGRNYASWNVAIVLLLTMAVVGA